MYAVDLCSGGPSSIARFCFFGIGGRVSFTLDLEAESARRDTDKSILCLVVGF